MLQIGLTGGLASGKTLVGMELARLGCHLIQADQLGHQVLLPEGEAYAQVVREFGPEILDRDGKIDRKALGAVVFNDPARLANLSAIVHLAVRRLQEQMIEALRLTDPDGMVVVEAAILVETGSYKKFDRLIVAACTLEQQIERAMRRDGLSREEVLLRLGRQLPLEEKKRLAHYVIDTSGLKESTIQQTGEVYRLLRAYVAGK